MTMRVIICGGRRYWLTDEDRAQLDQLHSDAHFIEVITGGASGADTGGRRWAEDRGIDSTVIGANWDRYGKAAGSIRNKQMLDHMLGMAKYDLGQCLVVAFPGSHGTGNMVALARAAGVVVVEPK